MTNKANDIVEQLLADAEAYRNGMGQDNELSYQWDDKPHRHVYDLCRRLEEAAEEIRRLREALEYAAFAIEDWAGYASDYFKEKHDLQGDLDKVRQSLLSQETKKCPLSRLTVTS